MSSQLDYWKSIKAKNSENASQKAHSNQDIQDSQSSTQSRFSDTDYSRRGYSQAHSQVRSQSSQQVQSQSHAQSHPQSRPQTNPRTLSQEYSSTRSQLRGRAQVHGQAQLHGQQPHMNSHMRPQVSKRPLRTDRVLRSQDFLQSRDDEIMDRPSAGYRHEDQPDGTYRGASGRYRSFNERYGIDDRSGIESESGTRFRSPSRFDEVDRGGNFRNARERHDHAYGESAREARDFGESRVAREGRRTRNGRDAYRVRDGRDSHVAHEARDSRGVYNDAYNESYNEAHRESYNEPYDEAPRGVRGVAARVAGNVAGKIPFGGRDRRDTATSKVSSATSQAAAPARSDAKPTTKSPHDARKLGKSYMPGLDGLRALAVLAVLLYHISPNQFIGGYIGVDLFFVISGFLITYRNLQNIQNPNKKFTLKNFWLRRARRLIPALVLVILVCVPIGAIIYPDILVGAFRQVAGALTYSTNWVEIIHGSNYFDQANPSLFKNFWSLAVEEQFYIIWPPLLLLLLSRRLKNSQLITIVATIAVASMVLMGVLAAPDNYTRVYYGTDTHCFGLAMGIIFAFIWNKEKGSLSKEWLSAQPWIPALAPVGLIGFALIVMLVPDTAAFTYPFGLVLGSLFSLFLVGAVIIRPDTLFTRIMELAPLRWLGVRSYGIYLWHWPMLVFGRILIPTAMGTVENVAVDVLFAFISFIAADLSYRFVEEPMRKDGFIKSLEKLVDRARDGIVGRVQAGVCVVLVIATIIAIATAPAKTQLQMQIEQQQAEQAQQAQDAQQNNTEGGSPQDPGSIPNYDESQMKGIPDSSTITAIGDSLISGNSIGFEEEFPEINFLAEPIRQWEQGVEVVKEGNQQGLIRQNVILDFGTNGGVADEDLVRQVLDELGPNRRILLYNIYSPSTFVDEANEIYEKFAEEYPNVYLVDWNSVASAHPEYLLSDRTHTNIEGQNAFVAAAKEVFKES